MEVDYISGKKRDYLIATTKYQREIHERLKGEVELRAIEYTSLVDVIKRVHKAASARPPASSQDASSGSLGMLLSHELVNVPVNAVARACDYMDKLLYACIVKKNLREDSIKHIASQELAYILGVLKLKNTILTCYDLVPWVFDGNRSFMWKLNMRGMRRAERIITISEFSKNEIVRHLGYPEDKIHVIYPAVDSSKYRRTEGAKVLESLGISQDERIVLYVGSEEGRKNLSLLIRALAKLRDRLSNIRLVKVGNPSYRRGRKELLGLIKMLGLEREVIFAGYVDEDELPAWYNAADLFVYPSLYEGFGLPPLEAMACGCPVITSNTSSLPEVVGDAGIMVDPHDVDALADAMERVLTDESLREDMRRRGLERAKRFSWQRSAREMWDIYEEVYHEG